MKKCVMTVVTSDMFQLYVPLFVKCIQSWGEEGVDAIVYIRGEMSKPVKDCMRKLSDSGWHIFENFRMTYPQYESTTNALRFTEYPEDMKFYEQVLITDVDLMLLKNPFNYLSELMALSGQPFAGHHGPYKKPHRQEICESWTGDFERVSGGFFLATPEWYRRTEEVRKLKSALLKSGFCGKFREHDEVILAQIIKESRMSVPKSRYFPADLRGVHLGDFKESMNHRWKNMDKMKSILTDENCMKIVAFWNNPVWSEIIKIFCDADKTFENIIMNLKLHLSLRGYV